jgi:hypothetical protein
MGKTMFNPSFPPFIRMSTRTRSSAFFEYSNNSFEIACMENPFEINGKDKEASDVFLKKSLLFMVRSFGIEAF